MWTLSLEVSLQMCASMQPNNVCIIPVANPKDFIEVKFDLESLDKPIALKSYMNTLVNSNDDL